MSAPIVVVGAGPAGCVAARVLADRGQSVLLLEAGPGDPRPAELDHPDHLQTTTTGRADAWWWPGEPPRGRGLGGGSAVNGMVLQAIDPRDVAEWGWIDASAHQAAVLARYAPTHVEPGPLTKALGLIVVREHPPGTPTHVGGSAGWCELSLALVGGVRQSVADAFLTEPPKHLDVRVDAPVDRIDGSEVVLESGERIQASRVVAACGAIGSPDLLVRSGLIERDAVRTVLNHLSATLVVELDDGLLGTIGAPPSSHLLTMATGLTNHDAADLQVLVLDHTGSSDIGRRHAAVIVSALEAERHDVLAEGVSQVRTWLSEVPGVLNVESSPDSPPVQHQCATLAGLLDTMNTVHGVEHVSVVDASALPGLPRSNPMLTIMVGAQRWAAAHPVR